MRTSLFRCSFGLALSFLVANFQVAQATQPNAYVLAVGVDQYQKASKLTGCANDATTAGQFFRSQEGKLFASVNTKVLVDNQATKENIEREMKALSTTGKAKDHIVLFLSGHGDKGVGGWRFLPVDFDSRNPVSTQLTQQAIFDLAQAAADKGQTVWIMIDSCFSGMLRVNAGPLLDRYHEAGQGGVLLMVSSAATQLTASMPTFSPFAKSVDEGLKGEADADGDGLVTLKEARRFTFYRLHQKLRDRKVSGHDCEMDHSPSLSESMILAHQEKSFIVRGKLTKQDPMDKVRQASHFKSFETTLPAGKEFVVDLMSGNGFAGPHNPGYFPTYLRVEDGKGAVLAERDFGGGGTNARTILTPAQAGNFRFVVSSSDNGAVGDFVLRVRTKDAYTVATIEPKSTSPLGQFTGLNPGQPFPGQPLPGQVVPGQPLNGNVFQGQLNAADPFDRMMRQSRHKVIEVKLDAGKVYQIDVMSNAFDTFLRVENSQGQQLAFNDDGGEGLNSRLQFRPTQTGTYRLIVTSFNPGELGAFVLSVQNR